MTREEALEFGNMWLQINEDCKDSSTYAFFQISVEKLEQESCDELDFVQPHKKIPATLDLTQCDLNQLPPINPQSKVGHWREVDTNQYACSHCNHCFSIVSVDNSIEEFKYCPNCRYPMFELQESEDEE